MQQTCRDQHHRSPDPGRGIGWGTGDHQGAQRHHAQRQNHRRFAAFFVSVVADDDTADRSQEEADTEGCQCLEQICHPIAGGKEQLADNHGKGGKYREIKEFQKVAESGGNNDLATCQRFFALFHQESLGCRESDFYWR